MNYVILVHTVPRSWFFTNGPSGLAGGKHIIYRAKGRLRVSPYRAWGGKSGGHLFRGLGHFIIKIINITYKKKKITQIFRASFQKTCMHKKKIPNLPQNHKLLSGININFSNPLVLWASEPKLWIIIGCPKIKTFFN